jgi:D-lactate dehydrogenase (cytochrome)
MAAFRHALPEAVNAAIGRARQTHPRLTKVGTDMAVPAASLELFLAEHRRLLGDAGLSYLIFGHIGDAHLHANVLPRDMDEYRKARAIYEKLALWAVSRGGTISAEHGVGKLKKTLLESMYGPAGIEEMRNVKRALDPKRLLQRGTMFD